MLRPWNRAWQSVALLTLNSAVALGIGNLAAFLVLLAFPSATGPTLDPALLQDAYPGRSLGEVRQIQRETWGRAYAYEPFTQFKEGPFAGAFVNVDAGGFRRPPGGAAWPPDPQARNVFVFGGSTTFGYGVADHETVPAQLERHLRKAPECAGVAVYNLGRSNYYSTQERILFAQLLTAGLVPTAAVFVDGLNEFGYLADEPKFTRRLGYLMAENPRQLGVRALKSMPLAKLLGRALPAPRPELEGDAQPVPFGQGEVAKILERWRENRRLIRAVAREYGVDATFVVQPVPSFDFDLEEQPFLPNERPLDPRTGQSHAGYEMLLERLEATPESQLLWLAGAHSLVEPPHYVDRVHYSATFSAAIASAIAPAIQPVLCGVSDS